MAILFNAGNQFCMTDFQKISRDKYRRTVHFLDEETHRLLQYTAPANVPLRMLDMDGKEHLTLDFDFDNLDNLRPGNEACRHCRHEVGIINEPMPIQDEAWRLAKEHS